jgi:glycosyltransferase involved in cell wall biosynthesis
MPESLRTARGARKADDILLVISHLDRGGSQRVLTTLANAWTRRGQKVSILTFEGTEGDFFPLSPEIERIVVPFIPAQRTFLRLGGLIRVTQWLLALRRAIRKTGAPIVVSFVCSTNIKVILACFGLPRMRLVISERNDPMRQQLETRWETRRRWLYRFADVVTANSRDAIDAMRPYVPECKLAFIPNPLTDRPNHQENREAERIPTLLAVGRLTEQKAYDVLLKAFSLVAPSVRPWRLAIVGDGPLEETLKAEAKQLNIASQIDWCGRQADPFVFYANADIFVMPSRYEGMPNALLEAMSQGLPPIITETMPGALDFVEHEVTGLVIPADDPDPLAAAIRRLIDDASLRRRLGEAARKRMAAYTLDAVLPLWDRIFGIEDQAERPLVPGDVAGL